MTESPGGDATFLFTDIEGSTRLWEEDPEAMRQALARHDSLLREVIDSNGGRVFKTLGDGFCAVFASPAPAAQAALATQLALNGGVMGHWGGAAMGATDAEFPESRHPVAPSPHRPRALRVRVALHTGQAELRDGDYFGPTVNRVARLLDAGHGGQILLSRAAREALGDTLPAGTGLKALGAHRLRDLQDPEHIFQLLHPELPEEFAPLRTVNMPWVAHHSQASRAVAPPWFAFTALRTATA
jgi:class 3 adenylate cyclase